jgi:polysaccharide export outer membrane protein
MRFYIIICLAFITFLSSCRTQRSVYNYLEDINDTTFRTSVYIAEPIIQKNDLLSIQIYSASLDPRVDLLYNTFSGGSGVVAQGGNNNMQGGGGQLGGYLVDVNGNVEIPRVGVIKAEGLKKSELEATVKSKLQQELNSPGVVVRFMNFRITMLGELGAPGILNIPSEKLTVLEAIGMAGGVTEFGTIKNVKVLREINGVRTLGVLDLTSKNIFTSPYYQLQQNDVVLVDQTRFKLRRTEQERVTQQIGFATGLISTVALLIAIFNR